MKRKSVLFATTLFFILFNCIYCHSANISAEEKSEKAKNYGKRGQSDFLLTQRKQSNIISACRESQD